MSSAGAMLVDSVSAFGFSGALSEAQPCLAEAKIRGYSICSSLAPSVAKRSKRSESTCSGLAVDRSALFMTTIGLQRSESAAT